MLVIAAYLNGVSNPWDMTDEELDAQKRVPDLEEGPWSRFFWDQSYELFQAFKREEVWIGYAWPDAYAYAKGAGLDVEYMNPKEGRITWSCGMGLFADSQNYHHAHAYVDSWSSLEGRRSSSWGTTTTGTPTRTSTSTRSRPTS